MGAISRALPLCGNLHLQPLFRLSWQRTRHPFDSLHLWSLYLAAALGWNKSRYHFRQSLSSASSGRSLLISTHDSYSIRRSSHRWETITSNRPLSHRTRVCLYPQPPKTTIHLQLLSPTPNRSYLGSLGINIWILALPLHRIFNLRSRRLFDPTSAFFFRRCISWPPKAIDNCKA